MKNLQLVLFGLLAFAQTAGTASCEKPRAARQLSLTVIEPTTGLRMTALEESASPRLMIVIPEESDSSGRIEVEFPEHVWGRKARTIQVERLYIETPTGRERTDLSTSFSGWRREGGSLGYEMDLKNKVMMRAQATLEPDGMRYTYTLTNHSTTEYEEVQAVTDPRLKGIFLDAFLERTYVHRNGRFELLASDTPQRLQMGAANWLPCRYLNAYEWPVPSPEKRVEKREGITHYNASHPVDAAFIATVSRDGKWIAATYTAHTGNVWSNPELTCQHADPSVALHAGETKRVDLKTFLFQGSLSDLWTKIEAEKRSAASPPP